MKNAQHIASALGQRQIAEAVGVVPTAVNNAVMRGSFPASWFTVIRAMCEENGLDCPESAFNFRSPTSERGAA